MIESKAHAAARRLREIGFVADSPHPVWFQCVLISMIIQPGRRKDIDERALAVADELGWTIEHQPEPGKAHPLFHFGYAGVRRYFAEKVTTQKVGKNHTLDDIQPYCATHNRSWHSSDTCRPGCEYGIRIR